MQASLALIQLLDRGLTMTEAKKRLGLVETAPEPLAPADVSGEAVNVLDIDKSAGADSEPAPNPVVAGETAQPTESAPAAKPAWAP